MDEFGMNNEAFASESNIRSGSAAQGKPAGGAARTARPAAQRNGAPRQQQPRGAQAPRDRQPRRQAPAPPPYGVTDLVLDPRTHAAVGGILLVTAVTMLVTTISHLAHGSADMSLAQSLSMSQMADLPNQPENIGGAFGAKLSQLLMSEGLGLGAFVLVYWLARIGLNLLGWAKCRFWAMSFRCLLAAVGVSVIAGFFGFHTVSYTHWGGSHGRFINALMFHYAGWVGGIALSLIVVSILAGVYLNTLIRARRLMKEKMAAMREHRRAKRERERNRTLQDLEARTGQPQAAQESIAFEQHAAEAAASLSSVTGGSAAAAATVAGAIVTSVGASASVPQTPVRSDIVSAQDELPADPLCSLQAITSEAPGGSNHIALADIPSGFNIDSDDDNAPFSNDDTQFSGVVGLSHKAADATPTAYSQPAAPASTYTEPAHAAPTYSQPAQPAASYQQPAAPVTPAIPAAPPAPAVELQSVPAQEPDFGVTVVDEPEQAPAGVAPGEHSGIVNPYDHRADLSRYRMPGIDLLDERDSGPVTNDTEQAENKDMIVNTLKSYNIPIAKIEATVGPTVTLYEIVPAEGVRIAQIKNLEDDIALSLAALGIRIIAPIPGKGTVGIEVPNRDPRTVSIRTVLGSRKFSECKMKLPMAMGTTINNQVFIRDLADMPHLLVAGGSGQGKSVGLNCIIASLLYYKHPSELKLVLIDPKMVEFSRYARLANHYLAKLPYTEDPVVTDPIEAVATLNSLCIEMDNRYRLLRDAGAVKVEEYNRKFTQRQLNPEQGHRYLPYIVIIVDEFADLIMTAGKEVSTHIARIAQKARAVGMHMIIATQRPSTDVITGMIKANFLGRIAFRVQQMVDSKTILDRPGANQLIGRGDMLFSHNGKLERVQCAFIDSDEVDRITRFVDDQVGYPEPYLLPEPPRDDASDISFDINHRDERFDECARFIVTQQTASTSSLQRRYGIGYNKAGKIMDQLEAAGIVGPAMGSKPRAVLVDSITLETILNG